MSNSEGMNENLINESDSAAPLVHARLSRHGLLVVRCPYCGQEHYHGRRGGAGHRVPDCPVGTVGRFRGYILKIAA